MIQDVPDMTPVRKRLQELNDAMIAPDFFQNPRRAAQISKEQQRLNVLVEFYENLGKTQKHFAENQEILKSNADPDLKALAKEDNERLQQEADALRQKILERMMPPDPNDSRNTILEIRAGTGGEEAALFAGDLFRMYLHFAETKGWSIEVLNSSPSGKGGFKEIIFLVNGEDVYKMLKFEAGGHRVQRIPSTEANGRIHTSAATVAVLPEAEEVDIAIKPDDLEITVCRASGPGGQGVNTTDSAVQICHKPSGLIVTCADERSQQKNRVKAMKVLRSRLLQQKEEEERLKYAENRKNQIGSGDRSERIRTYNIPQNRLTDHRIGLTLYNLAEILEGQLDAVLAALQEANLKERLAALAKVGVEGMNFSSRTQTNTTI